MLSLWFILRGRESAAAAAGELLWRVLATMSVSTVSLEESPLPQHLAKYPQKQFPLQYYFWPAAFLIFLPSWSLLIFFLPQLPARGGIKWVGPCAISGPPRNFVISASGFGRAACQYTLRFGGRNRYIMSYHCPIGNFFCRRRGDLAVWRGRDHLPTRFQPLLGPAGTGTVEREGTRRRKGEKERVPDCFLAEKGNGTMLLPTGDLVQMAKIRFSTSP